MFKKMKMLMIMTWVKVTTPERKGFLKSVHVRLENNKVRKIVAYYPSGDKLPEYEVLP